MVFKCISGLFAFLENILKCSKFSIHVEMLGPKVHELFTVVIVEAHLFLKEN
jgi:hypothetical protein